MRVPFADSVSAAGGPQDREVRESGVLIAEVKATLLGMPEMPTVLLRTRTDDDLDVLFDIAADMDTWEERNPWAPAPLTRKSFDARLARATDSDAPEGNVAFVVAVDGKAGGRAALFAVDAVAPRAEALPRPPSPPRHAEAGISLVADARGRGIGTAAVSQLVQFAFVRRNLRRVHLQAIASNTAAIRAYENAGFVVEGRLRQHAWVRGAYEDIVLMGILRSEQSSLA